VRRKKRAASEEISEKFPETVDKRGAAVYDFPVASAMSHVLRVHRKPFAIIFAASPLCAARVSRA